ncbi:stalk domain-containing protein [Paenibacillus puldeungensis]|uniref:Stalk domain-containing protein n=1 Tax=Paenibacillus puldeungensis TaxID=696536 RepID=A0ABW3RV14_9BACL
MRKFLSAFLSAMLVIPLLLQTQAQAAAGISVYIDGSRLATDQAPVTIKGRVMLPMRAIFEALGATVSWNGAQQTVTAQKDGTKIVLKMKNKAAMINNEGILLDVPAQSVKGRTMVPVRFVSEALGQEVNWDSRSKIVTIITSGSGGDDQPGSSDPYPVSYVTGRDVGDAGDGRDLEVSFSKSSNESRVDHYRVFVVKSGNASSFNLTAAQRVSSGNYTTLSATGNDPVVRLTSSSRDVDGALIRENQPYAAFVLAVGKGNSSNALSSASPVVTLDRDNSVPAATNVNVSDINDYGDGRDLTVSFTRPQNESSINNYRIFVVKTKDAGSFNLAAANNVSSSYSTVVYKSGSSSTLTGTLSSSSRDTSGELIKNGVPYTVFVMSVSNNTNTIASKLSTGSSSITLSIGSNTPVINKVEDINDNGDGRDLRVTFTRVADESKISAYRIFVVKDSNYSYFNLTKANGVSGWNYTQVNKTGGNTLTQTLSSGARDVDGDTIRNGVNYRVFVMAVGSGYYNGTNTLSSASSVITLMNSYSVGVVSNLALSDVSDYNDGRDLRVSFNRASDESNISHYRIMVVKSQYAGSFDLSKANAVNSDRYTYVSKNGYTLSQVLSSGAKDVDGSTIRNGVSYRVFVLSVSNNSNYIANALSSYSSEITLTNNFNNVGQVSNIVASDVADNNDGRDLQVQFNRASDESNISHYRIMVVKSQYAGSFDLSMANAVSSDRYTYVSKNGNVLKQTLSSWAKDVDGAAIRNGVSYRIFVLSLSNNNTTNALTSYSSSPEITLTNNFNSVGPASNVVATDIADNKDGRDLQVQFNRAADETNISHYRVMVVKSQNAGSFDVKRAEAVDGSRYTYVSKNGNVLKLTLNSGATDVDGAKIQNGVSYRVFVLSAGSGSYAGKNALSDGSSDITLYTDADKVAVPAVQEANITSDAYGITVSFTQPLDNKFIEKYAVIAAEGNISKDNAINALTQGGAVSVSKGRDATLTVKLDKDINGTQLNPQKITYKVYILSVPDMTNSRIYALSNAFPSTLYTPPKPASEPIKQDPPVQNPAPGTTPQTTTPTSEPSTAK